MFYIHIYKAMKKMRATCQCVLHTLKKKNQINLAVLCSQMSDSMRVI